MESWMLAKAKQKEKCIIVEKEVTYRTRRRHRLPSSSVVIDNPEKVQGFMQNLFDQSPVEILYALAINSSNELLGFVKIAQGTVNRAAVYPRGLLTFLLVETNASAVILAHNHPGGRSEPSREDIALTRRIESILKEMDVAILDHLIYSSGGEPEWISLRQDGYLS